MMELLVAMEPYEGKLIRATRPADERDIPLVVAWLREQGAIDYEAGSEVYSTQAGESGWILEATKRVVDAALRVEGEEE